MGADFAFGTKTSLYIGMDFCKGGDFFDFMYDDSSRIIPEEDIKIYIGCICLALDYL
jgi:serine/threonine protein kinase